MQHGDMYKYVYTFDLTVFLIYLQLTHQDFTLCDISTSYQYVGLDTMTPL